MKAPLGVLLVDDSEDDALLVLRALRRGGYAPDFKIVDTAEAMHGALSERSWDMVISDYAMPGFSAAAALKLAKERDPDLPFIVVSGVIGEETAVEVMRAGAHDFLLKNKLALLPAAVKRELQQAADRRAHRKTKKALRKEALKYNTLLETLTDVVFTLNTDGEFDYLNSEFERLTGYPVRSFIGCHFSGLIASDYREQVLDKFAFGSTGESMPPYEIEIKTKSGRLIPVELKMTSLYDEDGCPTGCLGLARDIYERKQAEDDLRESEEKYRSMMESMKEPVYICSPDFRVEYMNPTMIKRTGRDAVGQLCFKTLHGLDAKCPWCLMGQEQANGNLEFDVVSPKDDRSYHVSQSPISHSDGSVSMITVLRDTTDLKNLETRLQQAQKMESLGTLAGGIAHDFNNILSPILWSAELLLEDVGANSPLRHSLEGIRAGTLRAIDLVKQILTFSRQESYSPRSMRLQPVVKDALRLLRATISAEIEIRQVIHERCGMVMADPTQIHQVVMNLVTNAYHAMEANGGTLQVTLEEVVLAMPNTTGHDIAPGNYACLTVTDSGSGIDEALLGKIFDPFFTTKAEGKGTGLGLAVVHGIVRKAGGTIQVDSRPGTGSKFQIYLPVLNSPAEQPRLGGKGTPAGGTEHILFVDDEVAIAKVEKQMLERLGYQVTAHCSSREALAAFRAAPGKFDLVITDMAMPQLSGEKLAMALKKIRPDIPILLCTGFSEKINRANVRQKGISGFLAKPVIPADMARSVREILDKQQGV